MAGIQEFATFTPDPEEKMSDALAHRLCREGHPYDFTPAVLFESTPHSPLPANQHAAEALRVSHFHLQDTHEAITVQHVCRGCIVKSTCYSDESAAAMVLAFNGTIV